MSSSIVRFDATVLRAGTALLAAALFLVLLAPSGAAERRQPRLLIIAVDAIPYDLVVQRMDPALGDKALFKDLRGPAAVINAFPTNSYVAWTGLLEPLGIGKSDGHEPRHFDTGRLGVQDGYSLTETRAPWKEFFDWRYEGIIRGAIAYGWPRHYSRKEIDWGLEAFLASDKEVFAMYVMSTDGVGHLYGPEAFGDVLRHLDERLGRLKREHPDKPFHTFIFSDHGMAGGEPLTNTWPAVKRAMREAGFRLRNRLKHDTDVAIISFGLLSSFVAYTWPGRETEVASAATSVPGVDRCVVPAADGWHVFSACGTAATERRMQDGRSWWSYRPLTGDPLGDATVIEALRERAGDPKASWFPDGWWFEATKHHFYPDAPYRLARAFDLVRHPASVACSVSPGHMFGGLLTEYVAIPTIGRLRWTHGALHRDASLGFALSDLPGGNPPDAVRFDQALSLVAARLRN